MEKKIFSSPSNQCLNFIRKHIYINPLMPKLYKIYQHKIKNVSIQFMARGHANL